MRMRPDGRPKGLFVGFLNGKLNDFLRLAVVEESKILSVEIADGVSGGIADHDGDNN